MRLLFVVQRYGTEVAGGAEFACRQFATRLAGRGHDVEALTSCAVSHADWANVYPEGVSDLDGVRVHRLAVRATRDDAFFGPVNERVVWGVKPVPLHLERRWIELQGPLLPELGPWLSARASGYDAVVFFTYLYYSTWAGLPAASGRAPTVLHPTAHDEPALGVRLYDTTFRHPSAFAFFTEEEASLVQRRFRISPPPRTQPHSIIGIGADLEAADHAEPAAFRETYGLGDRPYLVFVGRVEPGKGSEELFAFFAAYKRRNPGPLALVVVGSVVEDPGTHPDVVFTGFVDQPTKHSALAGAVALVQPSFYESFSMVLNEAWVQQTPVLVQGHCAVLEGQARRSRGGIPYRGFPELEAAVDLLVADPDLRRELGSAGRRYTEEHYHWDAVLDRYERLLAGLVAPRS